MEMPDPSISASSPMHRVSQEATQPGQQVRYYNLLLINAPGPHVPRIMVAPVTNQVRYRALYVRSKEVAVDVLFLASQRCPELS